VTYEWEATGGSGRWVDAAYPRILADTVDDLKEALQRLDGDAE